MGVVKITLDKAPELYNNFCEEPCQRQGVMNSAVTTQGSCPSRTSGGDETNQGDCVRA